MTGRTDRSLRLRLSEQESGRLQDILRAGSAIPTPAMGRTGLRYRLRWALGVSALLGLLGLGLALGVVQG